MITTNPTAGPRGPGRTWRVGTLTYTAPGLAVLFGWLLWGDFAWSMRDRTVGPVLQVMLKKYDASDTLTGILIGSLPLGISMILSPIVSYLSDRHRGRWGRRIPFLLAPTPFAVLAMIGLAFSPVCGDILHRTLGTHSPGAVTSVLIVLGVLWTLFEISTMIANAVFTALSNDVVPQSVMGFFFGAFRGLSLFAGIVFNAWFFEKSKTHYAWIFGGMGLLYGIGFTLMCLNVREGDYPPPPPATAHSLSGFLRAAKQYFSDCFGHSYYWWFYAATALSWMAFMPFNLFNYYYAEQLRLDFATYAHCNALAYTLSLILALPLGILADRVHPLRLGLVVQFLYILTTITGGLLVHGPTSFAVVLVTHAVLSGTWMTATASLAQRLLPREEFAQFASAAGIITSLCGMIPGPIVGCFLDRTGHHYRETFFMSAGLAIAAFVAGIVLYRKFLALGGTKAYVAPLGSD